MKEGIFLMSTNRALSLMWRGATEDDIHDAELIKRLTRQLHMPRAVAEVSLLRWHPTMQLCAAIVDELILRGIARPVGDDIYITDRAADILDAEASIDEVDDRP